MSEAKFLPRRISFKKLCDMLLGYLNAGADKDYISVKDAAEKAGISLEDVSRNNLFLKSWGFIEESKEADGKYRLSTEIAEFASAYRIDPESDQTRKIMENFLAKNDLIMKFVDRIRRDKPERNSILVDLSRLTGDLKADKVGLNAFLDILVYAFKLEEALAPAKPAKLTRVKVKPIAKISPKISRMPVAPLSITLAISPETPPEKLKEYIKVALEAYDEYREER